MQLIILDGKRGTLDGTTDSLLLELLIAKGMRYFNKTIKTSVHIDGLYSYLKAPINKKKE